MKNRHSSRRVAHMLAILLLTSGSLLTFSGCTSLKTPSYLDWLSARNRVLTPTRITSFWKAYALKTEGAPPQRSLGGRVMFYDDVDNQPIRVDGTVTFFVYDAKETDPDKAKPLIVYQFPPERVKQAYSKSELGHSYSFLIPFDEMNGPEMEVLIHPRIDTLAGGVRVIAQESSRLYLPGKPTETSPESMISENASPDSPMDESRVQPASFEEKPSQESQVPRNEPRTMSTETIDVSPAMRQRLESPLSETERERIERVGRYSFPNTSEFHTRNGETPSGLYDDGVQEYPSSLDADQNTYDEAESDLETVIDMSPARGAAHTTPMADHPIVPPSPTRR